MRKTLFVFAALAVVPRPGSAAHLAIIDSGVDYKHKDLAPVMWKNPESKTVAKDATYENDTHGWNFAEKNNKVIDHKYLGTFSADCRKIFEVQAKILQGTNTPEEKSWYDAKKKDATFTKELSKFGNFVHGSHVAGISSEDSPSSKIIALKLIPTESPIGMLVARYGYLAERDASNPLAKMMLDMLAKQQAKLLVTTGNYTAAVKADVANGSFGTSVAAVKPIVANLLKTFLGKEPSEEEAKEYAAYFVTKIAEASKDFVGAAPSTLFVFAAGNDGSDNHVNPVSPANIKADNTIAVAATLGVSKLASFSNWGNSLVEVAAPGVAIDSTIPGDERLAMSGTSMAAPYVTNVAGRVKDTNKSLNARDIKKVLMDTVDKKDFLNGKVATGGVVNKDRALEAARLSLSMPLDEAIAQARSTVADQTETLTADELRSADDGIAIPLPSPL